MKPPKELDRIVDKVLACLPGKQFSTGCDKFCL